MANKFFIMMMQPTSQ